MRKARGPLGLRAFCGRPLIPVRPSHLPCYGRRFRHSFLAQTSSATCFRGTNVVCDVLPWQKRHPRHLARLTVDPQPDMVIRVFMAWSSLEAPVQVEPQVLQVPVREGFTVVEWGGGEVSPL